MCQGRSVAGPGVPFQLTTGTGTGFNGEWATSSDGGTTWFSDDDYPLQMQVTVT